MIELRGVSCGYGEDDALAGVDLSVAPGEAVAVLGPNGCGKSTLLKLLNGIILPRAGRYRFDGQDMDAASLKDPRFARRFHQRVGFLFQNVDAQLFCPRVEEEVAFGPLQMGLGPGEVARRVEDCLGLLGIGHLRDRVPYHLSEGEKRKVALASVLALNPEVLVLDEPLNGLDPRAKAHLRELLAALVAAGRTLLCSTHDFRNLEGVFHTALALGVDHRVARRGPCGEILGDKALLRDLDIA